MRDSGDTEVGCYGISSEEDPLLIEDIRLVNQECSWAWCEMDGDSMGQLMEELFDQGVVTKRCTRIWIHTHPGNSAHPSMTDETTFEKVFGKAPWSVMAILAKEEDTYARMSFGTGGDKRLAMAIDWSQPFEGSDQEAWYDEYTMNVKELKYEPIAPKAFFGFEGRSFKESDDFRGRDLLDDRWKEAFGKKDDLWGDKDDFIEDPEPNFGTDIDPDDYWCHRCQQIVPLEEVVSHLEEDGTEMCPYCEFWDLEQIRELDEFYDSPTFLQQLKDESHDDLDFDSGPGLQPAK